MKKILLLLIAPTLAACTHGSLKIENASSINKERSLLPAMVQDMAQVCFIREENSLNTLPGVSPDIRYGNGTIIGELKPKNFFCYNIEPDEYTFTSNSSMFIDRTIDIVLPPNKTTFIEWQVHDYFLWQTSSLEELSSDVALSKISRIKK